MPPAKQPQAGLVPDPRQQEAIDHVHGPMLVVAGAGTGKTTVLTKRVGRLVEAGHARPEEILAVTYTLNGAAEMTERIRDELKRAGNARFRAYTFHEYCLDLLQRHQRSFGVLDDKDLWVFLRKHARDLNLRYFTRAANIGEFLTDLIDFMRRCHDELISPVRYVEYVQELERGLHPLPRVAKTGKADEMPREEVLARCHEIAHVYHKTEELLREQNLGTFGHMITRAYQVLRDDTAILAQERQRARFALIDEFQDTNFAQVKLHALLAGEEKNVFAVGDPDQGIYRFRGASSGAFKLFERQWPGARVVVLEKNRRSTTEILRCAFAIIDQNPQAFEGLERSTLQYRRTPLISARDEELLSGGVKPANQMVEGASGDSEQEAVDVAQTILAMAGKKNQRWDRFAVLYRSHAHAEETAAELAASNIPCAVENMDLYDTPEVRDVVACLKAVAHAGDAVSLFRVAAMPEFQIRPEDFRSAMNEVSRRDDGALASRIEEELSRIAGGQQLVDAVRLARQQTAAHGWLLVHSLPVIFRSFGINTTAPAIAAFIQFLQAWRAKAITETGQLGEFLDYLEHFREARGSIPAPMPTGNVVRLLTAHAAKGLEFENVFILRAHSPYGFPTGYKETLFEFPRELRDLDSVSDLDSKVLHEEEERRLFYVAMTRARDTLTIYCKTRTKKLDLPKGPLKELAENRNLRPYLRVRAPRPFQTDIFGNEGRRPEFVSRTTEWLDVSPARQLHARLSASAVQSYDRCPLQFKIERDWRLPDDVPAAMQFGAVIHAVLKDYFDARVAGHPMTLDEVLVRFREQLAKSAPDDAYQYELYLRQGATQLSDFVTSVEHNPPHVLHTESHFDVPVGNTVLVGRIDRVDRVDGNKVRITDYKTGKQQSQEDADESLQLSIYAIAAQRMWGYDVEATQFHNLDGNQSVKSSRDSVKLSEALAKVEQVAHDIAAGSFEPTPKFKVCDFCAFRSLCPRTEKRAYLVNPNAPAANRA
jgi:DNA helicase-2/ATP-dependent DNA helicase PcrA